MVVDLTKSPDDMDWLNQDEDIENAEGDTDFRLADVPGKYVDGTGLSEDDFVPNESIADVIDPTLEFIDKHGLPNPDNQKEGAARINQLKDHIDNNEPLAPEFWQEISNFHSRHRAQGNDECDESSLPDKADDVDFDECHFDPGWFSDRTWGGDPAKEQADRIVEAIESTEGVELSDVDDVRFASDEDRQEYYNALDEVQSDGMEPWERDMLGLHQRIWAEDNDKQLVSFTETAVPEFVQERLRQAVIGGAVFGDIENVGGADLNQLRQNLADELTQDGWTTDTVTDAVQEVDPTVSRSQAETIARSETASVVNSAREIGYEEQGLEDDDYYWVGSVDDRTTEACEWLINETNPNYGGDPVSLDELQDLIAEAPEHDDDMQDNLARPKDYVVHPNERKTFVRDV